MNRKQANEVVLMFEQLCRSGMRMSGNGGYGYSRGMGGYGMGYGGGMMSGYGGGRMSFSDMMGECKKGEFMGMNGLMAQMGLRTQIQVKVKKTNEILAITTYEKKFMGVYFYCDNGKKYHASKLELYGGAEDENEDNSDDTYEDDAKKDIDNNVFINSYQNTHYTGTGNIYNAVATISTNPLRISLRPVLSATSSDYLAADEDNAIYVNISSEIEGLDGKSWETAYGGVYCFDDAVYEISNGGTIYLANGNYLHEDYDGIYPLSFTKNMTFIGQGSKTNLTNIEHHVYGDKDRINCIYTFINLTLTGKMFGVNSNFIN